MGLVGLFIFNDKKTAPDTDNLVFQTDKVREGRIAQIDSAMVGDYTRANKLCILGIRDSSNNDDYINFRKAAQYYQVHLVGQLYLYGGERLIGIVESPTASDVCYFSVHGKEYDGLPVTRGD